MTVLALDFDGVMCVSVDETAVCADRTIAEFRKVNGEALRATCKDFVVLCKAFDLQGGEVVAIDGACFHASASDASVVTKTALEKLLKQLELDIEARWARARCVRANASASRYHGRIRRIAGGIG
ncbi:MAG: hypothetical protein LJE60_14835 [Thiocapsa sp.]|jgi:hypothetical protein|nr:hypothetical protein [Thiocapsa sp.]MCG6898363.1 hypothetical protein [Thiocapsa sp.]